MARSMVVTFPASSTTALMDVADVDASLVLNLSTIPSKTWNTSIIGTGDLSGHTFTITGTDVNGSSINETITGALADIPSTTTKQFKTITSIITKTAGVPAPVANVKSGVMDLIVANQGISGTVAAILNTGDNAAFTFATGTAYQLAFTSPDDNSLVTFAIVGTDMAGNPQNENLGGPNADTVFSVNSYNSITSITPDIAATNISVGSEEFIAALQTTGADGVMTLTASPVVFPGQEWKLDLSSSNNLSTANFSITGTNLSGASTEVIAGPNNDYINTVNDYSTVSSIFVSKTVSDITVGIPTFIAPSQALGGAGDLLLKQETITFPTGTAYKITLKSSGNVSGVNFTITGTDIAGAPQNEVLVGPNTNTVKSTKSYNSITSIAADGITANISAGVYGIIAATQDVTVVPPVAITLKAGYPTIFPNIARKITLTSIDDNSAVDFTITGTDIFGAVITEVLAGPNGNTVASVLNYHTITSIVPSAGYLALSIGTGSTGYTQWVYLNQSTNPPNTLIQVDVTGTINYSVTQTLDALASYVPVTYWYNYVVDTTQAAFAVTAAMTGATTDQIYSLTSLSAALKCTINSSTGGSLVLTITQAGI